MMLDKEELLAELKKTCPLPKWRVAEGFTLEMFTVVATVEIERSAFSWAHAIDTTSWSMSQLGTTRVAAFLVREFAQGVAKGIMEWRGEA
jgi:hypothetical protein